MPPEPRPSAVRQTSYLPALGYRRLTWIYDFVVAHTMHEHLWRPRLVATIAPQGHDRILDIGCGTGTLAVALKTAAPSAAITGLDPDAIALDLARRRSASSGVDVEFVAGLAQDVAEALGRSGRHFDKVVSSLMFHHLDEQTKSDVLLAIAPLIEPVSGRLIILDWGAMPRALDRLRFLPVRLLDGFGPTRANVEGRLPELLAATGYRVIDTPWTFQTVFGPLATWIAARSL